MMESHETQGGIDMKRNVALPALMLTGALCLTLVAAGCGPRQEPASDPAEEQQEQVVEDEPAEKDDQQAEATEPEEPSTSQADPADPTAGESAVKLHVMNIRRKLGADIVETVRGVGYRVPKDRP